MSLTDLVASLRAIPGYPQAIIEKIEGDQARHEAGLAEGRNWAALLSDADRAAAALLGQFARERAGDLERAVGNEPAFGLMKKCTPLEKGALVTAVFASMRMPAWAAALGLDRLAPPLGHGRLVLPVQKSLIDRLLRHDCELSPTLHRVLVLGLIEHQSSSGGNFDRLGELVAAYAMANPGVNRAELSELFEAVGGEVSLLPLAQRLRVPLNVAAPTKLSSIDEISPEQHRQLSEWVDHWTAIHADISEPRGRGKSIARHVGEFLKIHAMVFRRHNGRSPYNDVPFHHEILVHDQLAEIMEEKLSYRGHIEPTFDYEWFNTRVATYDAWQALGPDARWWVDIARVQSDVGTSPPLLGTTFGSTETLFDFLAEATTVKPSSKWSRSIESLCAGREGPAIRLAIIRWLESLAPSSTPVERVGRWFLAARYRAFAEVMLPVIETYGDARSAALRWMCMSHANTKLYSDGSGDFGFNMDDPAVLTWRATNAVRGAVWALTHWTDDETVAIIGRTAARLLIRSKGGYRSLAAANACILALSEIGTPAAIMALDRLRRRTRDGAVAKQLEKAKARAAEKAGLTISELEELSVPTHGLDADGRREWLVGGGAALIAIDGTTSAVALTWRTPDGKIMQALPNALKSAKDEVKAVKASVKAIEVDLAVLAWRIQAVWLEDRRWTPEAWRERYVEHPLVAAISRRLIWNAHRAVARTAGVWRDGTLVDLDGQPISLDGATISLWHPIGCEVAEVMDWRRRLGECAIVQPFKQAHREVYLVTDAERGTDTYSNRFAGHIIKQQQMMALARLSGWATTVHTGYDNGLDKFPSRIALRQAGLVAEYWMEGFGDDDFTANGAHLYLSTDQLRFIRPNDMAKAAASLGPSHAIDGVAVPIADVPPLILSEIMRHCDLFVGVASIANDPAWIDAGRDGHWRRRADDYWRDRSFGDIGASGETRRDLLLALLPSLALGKVSRIEGHYLRVEGKLRAYKIHLGSGNILMEPNDEYLCIVPAAVASDKQRAFLSFEGDALLSLILSKAALLAADDKIKDSTILSQIRR